MYKATTKWVVKLPEEEEEFLWRLVTSGTSPARVINRARILLKANQAGGRAFYRDEEIVEALDIGHYTVEMVRKKYAQYGLEAALYSKPMPERPDKRKLDGRGEAHLIALACGQPPEGRLRWTLKLLAERLVELECCTGVSPTTVGRVLKKTNSSRGRKSNG